MSAAVPEELGLPLQGSLAQQVVDRVFCTPQCDASVSVAERDKCGAWCNTGFGQQADWQLDTALVIDTEFGWFSEHEESVALSVSEGAERLKR
ncbi:hypothetical protein [Streptomyces taklimakanensis]|uniref:hypothetical protein n=1 Tax=Streptomyces taklimakanensis TaxID=2569853 RepID=UPI00192E42DE|nr:hypothetical protein [Streptomyces taklimakanensis]